MPRLEPDICRERFASQKVARLATVDAEGRAHVVPVVFAVQGDVICSPIDHKPKTTTDLVRARNIERDPRVTLLVDHYEDDWARLWWVRARGSGSLVHDGPRWERAAGALTERYEQYRSQPLTERILLVEVTDWSGWAFTGAP